MEKISWSPKVRASKIRQLYENDARGTVDEVLVEDVGLTLLQRCQSIRLVTRREVECPRCGTAVTLCEPGTWKMLPGVQLCPTPGCGWETTYFSQTSPPVECWISIVLALQSSEQELYLIQPQTT